MSDEQRKKALETIERNAKAQARLIEDLLDVSRIISGKLRLDVKPLNLAEIVGNVVENLRPAAEAKNISIKVNNNFREALVLADGERIQQVVFNLLSNAVKFTQESGRIDVGINRVNSHYEIKVKDNGRGIGTEFLPFVFDRFRQAERLTVGARAGLGLGLAISKSLVEAHGGEIFVESEGEDKGATFTVNIPIAVQQPAVLESAGLPLVSPIGSPRLGDLRILMVDDDPDACDVVRAVLEEHGATVFTATSAGRAFELFRREKPDVIISDIIMPEENGYQFIKRIRSLERSDGGREVPAVALTAKARVEDRLEALTAGFQMHVPKPIEPAELEVVIASLTARNQQH
jgi:CheY-like chemotaxis protein